jgi:3-deoxy-D-manno-octulosonate 8-phosphate phosphatase KdsC-like HAD superfamily phosphatase
VSQQDNSPASDPSSSKNPTQNNSTDDKGGDTDGIILSRKRKRQACLGSENVDEFLAFHTDLVIKCLGDDGEEARILRACVLLLASQGAAQLTNHHIAHLRKFTNGNSELKDALDMMETCSRGFGR